MGAPAERLSPYLCPCCRRPWGVVQNDDRLYVGALEVLTLTARCPCGNVKVWRAGPARPRPPEGRDP